MCRFGTLTLHTANYFTSRQPTTFICTSCIYALSSFELGFSFNDDVLSSFSQTLYRCPIYTILATSFRLLRYGPY